MRIVILVAASLFLLTCFAPAAEDPLQLPRLRSLSAHQGNVLALTFLPESKTLVSASEDGTIRFWDAESGEPIQKIKAHAGGVRSVASSPDGRTLATAGFDGIAKLWNTRMDPQPRELEGRLSTSKGNVVSIVWSPDSKRLAASGDRVVVWDRDKGKQLRVIEIEGLRSPMGDYAAWTSSRELVTAGDEMSTIRSWNVDTGEAGQQWMHRGHIHSLAINPERDVLVTGGHSPYLTFFGLTTGTKTIVRSGDPHYWLSWSPDGNTLAAGPILLDASGNVRATVDAWQKKTTWLMWSTGPVVAWSSNSRMFATIRGKDIDLWDTTSLTTPNTAAPK